MDFVNYMLDRKDKEVREVRYFKDESVRPKNAYAIGKIGKVEYVALMFREEDERGRFVYTKKIHTLKTDKQERIDVPQEEVEEVFNKILFY